MLDDDDSLIFLFYSYEVFDEVDAFEDWILFSFES